jgi:hypothetical protein
MVFDGGCLARTRFGVVWARLRFGGKTGGLALFLKSGDEFQGCGSWECRQLLFRDVLGGLKNELIARCQDLDRLHEFLSFSFGYFDFHAGSLGRGVGHWLGNLIF